MILHWSKRAIKHVKQSRDYITLDSPFYAQQFIWRMSASIEMLVDFPQGGRLVPETERDCIREIIYQGYRAIYMFRKAQQEVMMVVVVVVHGSRDLSHPENQTWDKPVQ